MNMFSQWWQQWSARRAMGHANEASLASPDGPSGQRPHRRERQAQALVRASAAPSDGVVSRMTQSPAPRGTQPMPPTPTGTSVRVATVEQAAFLAPAVVVSPPRVAPVDPQWVYTLSDDAQALLDGLAWLIGPAGQLDASRTAALKQQAEQVRHRMQAAQVGDPCFGAGLLPNEFGFCAKLDMVLRDTPFLRAPSEPPTMREVHSHLLALQQGIDDALNCLDGYSLTILPQYDIDETV